LADYVFTSNETASGSDSRDRSVAWSSQLDEALTASDSVAYLVGNLRPANDTASAADTTRYTPGSARRSDDTATATDGLVVVLTKIITINESPAALEGVRRLRGLYFVSNETGSPIDDGDGHKQYPRALSDTVLATDSLVANRGITRNSADNARANDSTSFELKVTEGVRLALYALRDGSYQEWLSEPSSAVTWPLVRELGEYDTDEYVYLAGGEQAGVAVTYGFQRPKFTAGIPQRIAGINIEWIVKGGTSSAVKPFFVLYGQDWTDDDFEFVAPSTWSYIRKFYPTNPFDGRLWSLQDLLQIEIGLINSADQEADGWVWLTRIQVDVMPESLPYITSTFIGGGRTREWSVEPSDGGGIVELQTPDSGRTYVTSSVAGELHQLQLEKPLLLPSQFQIDSMQLHVRATGEGGSLSPSVRHEHVDWSGPVGSWEVTPTSWSSYRFPFSSPPTWAADRWEASEILATDWGVRQAANGEVRVTSVTLETFASLKPQNTVRLLATSGGAFNWWEANPAGSLQGTVATYYPDDTTYLLANAEFPNKRAQLFSIKLSTSRTEHPWYGLRLRARVRRDAGYSGDTQVAWLFRDGDSDITWLGRAWVLDDSSQFWEIADTFWVNPFTGAPWQDDELDELEIGLGCLTGVANCSWLVADAGIARAQTHPVTTAPCELTTTGVANTARCVADSLVWVVDKALVGRGGYDEENPAVAYPVTPDDDTLADPLAVELDVARATSNGYTAYYWIVVPPDVFQEPIGEIALRARIVSSNNPGDTPGEYFTLAVAHFPGAFHTYRSIRVLRVEVNFNS
jgi:hypothetical protein